MPEQHDQVADGLASVQETLSAIGIDEDSSGDAATAIRQALTARSAHMQEIAAAARAVAQASRDREALVAQRDAAMPTEAEIQAAQEAVIDAAGTEGEQPAIDRLAELLAQKREAQQTFDRGEKHTANTLDSATGSLPGGGSSSAFPAALGPLTGLLSSLGRGGMPAGGGMPAAGGTPDGSAPTAFSPEGADPVAALLDSLGANDDDSALDQWGEGPGGGEADIPGELDEGAGQTHTAGSEVSGQQMPTLSGAVTNADVSGRGASPFTVGPGASSGAAGASPGMGAGGMPMAPPMGPMSGAGGGVAGGKGRDKTSIMNTDPDLTGADIDSDIATSGVIGRGEGQGSNGGNS